MAHPEKDRENSPENDPNLKKDPPKLDAIFPDDLPPAAAELVGDLDSYQKKMEKEWESAKSAYEDKINHIMEEFMIAGMANLARETEEKTEKKPTPPPAPSVPNEPKKKSIPRDEQLKNLMGDWETELRRAGQSTKRVSPPSFISAQAEPLQLGFQPYRKKSWKKWALVSSAVALIMASIAFFFESFNVQVDPLPYAHTLGPVVWKNNIYIIDWFRKSLYVHADAAGLPIRSVDPLPNTLATGFAISEKTIWTLDGLDRKILFHTTTPDHQVTSSVETQGTKPSGLFYDGLDLWSADQDAKKLYRHRGNDVEEIRDTYPLPDINITAIGFFNNRLWILDGKSRLINVYRLQKPLLQLGSFDLDPFVKGAAPTGFTFVGKKILIVTENPVELIRVPLFRLKKSKTEEF